MRLVIADRGAEFEFVEPRADGEMRWLTSVGTLLLAARAGHLTGVGIGETANVQVTLDNTGRQASRLLGRPLRALATIYDDAGALFFEGLVQNVTYGPLLTLGIED